MISYRQFRKLYETDAAATPPAATPQAPNIEDLEKQIDALFDELKTRIRSMYTPRKDWMSDLQAWAAGPKTEHLNLEYYHALDNYFSEFQEALNSSDLLLVDRLIDEYKAKFKQLMATYKQQMAAATPARTRRPRRSATDPVTPTTTTTGPEPAPAPAAGAGVVTPTEPEPEPAPATATATRTEPDPVEEKPEPAPATTTVAPAPATTVATGGGETTPEDNELIKLGAMVVAWHDDVGQMGVIPDDSMQELEKSFADFKPEDHTDDKDFLIKIARDYLKMKNGGSAADLKADLNAGPMKGDIESKPDETPVTTTPVKAEEAKPPTKQQLMAMKDEEFKQFVTDPANPWSDPQLEEMYEGEEWWKRRMRREVVDNYLLALEDRLKKKESLQHYVNRYKKLLREANRPQFLLREAAKLPLSKRIGFYRQKLSCRGT
jgi:hypothetical protein